MSGPYDMERSRARESALKGLSRASTTRAGLVQRLLKKGYEREVAEGVAQDMERIGAIDDGDYAEALVRDALRSKPAGRRLLDAKLRAKGVSAEIRERVLDEALSERDDLEDAIGVARRRLAALPGTLDAVVVRRRLAGAVARRGFEGDVCRRAVEAALRGEDRE